MTAGHHHGYSRRPELAVDNTSPLRRGVFSLGELPKAQREAMSALIDSSREPFRGLTTDGRRIEGLFHLVPAASPRAAVDAACDFLSLLDEGERLAAVRPLRCPERRTWTNAFAAWTPWGVCLDDLGDFQREAAMRVVAACLSPRGYQQTRNTMKLNEALGQLIDALRDTLREWMYWLTIFGSPSPDEPWGWQLMGHHLVLNCFLQDGQMVMTPAFLGAEPRSVEQGPLAGLREFDEEHDRGLELMLSLSGAQQEQATLFRSILSRDLPPELAGRREGRQRGGAGQDNAIVPYEGIPARELSSPQRALLLRLMDAYLERLPENHAADRRHEIARHADGMHFCWIGPHERGQPFYYKVHGPVIWIEFDCHAGVFLNNDEPEPFHVHTIVRTPNGNDYGMDLLRQHLERFHRAGDRQHHHL
jgi:Protein of unknown function (DUF3500)